MNTDYLHSHTPQPSDPASSLVRRHIALSLIRHHEHNTRLSPRSRLGSCISCETLSSTLAAFRFPALSPLMFTPIHSCIRLKSCVHLERRQLGAVGRSRVSSHVAVRSFADHPAVSSGCARSKRCHQCLEHLPELMSALECPNRHQQF